MIGRPEVLLVGWIIRPLCSQWYEHTYGFMYRQMNNERQSKNGGPCVLSESLGKKPR